MMTALGAVLPAVLFRPTLWRVAVVMALRMVPDRWWRRWPPLPVPDASYWRFRMTTAYGGSGDAAPDVRDLLEYLEWCRDRRRPRSHLR
jgi:hypothetical protein